MADKVPNIVATNEYSGQTTSIATTTIFTPSTDGLFRVNVVLHFVTGSGTPTISFTDERGTAGSVGVGINVFRAKASQPIQLALTLDPSSNANFFVVLESLD